MPFVLNPHRSEQVRKLKGTMSTDIISMAVEIGENPATFFEGGDWSGLDLTKTDVSRTSFCGATMNGITVFQFQFDQICATGPRSIDNAIVLETPSDIGTSVNDHEYHGLDYDEDSESRLPFVVSTHVDSVTLRAIRHEQARRSRVLFAAVLLGAIDEAIEKDKKDGTGCDQIAKWARSADGQEVLICSGIEPSERVVEGLRRFVAAGILTSIALDKSKPVADLF